MADNDPFPTSMTIDEMESAITQAKEPEVDPAAVAAAAPAAPPVVDDSPYKEALRISEEARQRTEAALLAATQARTPEPAPDGVGISDEDLAKLVEEKGAVAALRAVQAQTLHLMERHANNKLSTLHASGLLLAEQNARTKYPVEFEIFSDEIKKMVQDAPDKAALNNVDNWDMMLAYVRGKNIDKYMEHVNKKKLDAAAEAARISQVASAGASISPAGSSIGDAGADGFYGLDSTQREIADKLGQSYKDYAFWNKVGG